MGCGSRYGFAQSAIKSRGFYDVWTRSSWIQRDKRNGLQMLHFSSLGMGQNWPRHWPRQNDETKKATQMKFCYSCGKVSAGDPPFCNGCGRSYNVRLCPRLHKNSRWAKACSQCGARELSQPQPHVSFWWKVLEFVLKVAVAAFLVYVSLIAVVDLFRRPQIQAGLLVVGVMLGLLWLLWTKLPEWFRELVRRSLKRKENDRERH